MEHAGGKKAQCSESYKFSHSSCLDDQHMQMHNIENACQVSQSETQNLGITYSISTSRSGL